MKASGTEEAPSSMISSEAESESSVISETQGHEQGDGQHRTEMDVVQPQDKTSQSTDVRNSVISYITNRGELI